MRASCATRFLTNPITILMKGKIYLIPTPLNEDAAITASLPQHVLHICQNIRYYIVENEKTARKFLKQVEVKYPQNQLVIYILDKHQQKDYSSFLKDAEDGNDMAVLSEAGCPGIADPGADIVQIAHRKQLKVVPLVGPSSITLSLMASGFNGQSFTFHGYLPIDKAARSKKIQELERLSEKLDQTQLFIETPFRNNSLLDDLLRTCKPGTRLSVSCDLTGETELIASQTIAQWKKEKPDLHKRPAIFLLYKGV